MALYRGIARFVVTGVTSLVLIAGLLGTSAQADDAVATPAPPTPTATAETTTPSPPGSPPPVGGEPQADPSPVEQAAVEQAAVAPSTLSAELRQASVTTQENAVLDAEVTAQQNPDGGKVEVTVDGQTLQGTVAGGKVIVTFPRLRAGTHEVVATYLGNAEVEASPAVRMSLTVRAQTGLTLQLNSGSDRSFRSGETLWLRGQATDSVARPYARRFVTLYRYSGSKAYRVGVVRTSSSGWYALALKPSVSTTYRAVLGKLRSPLLKVTRVTEARTLESRELALRFLLGTAVSGRNVGSSVVWRRYQRGILAQVGSHTWLVRTSVLATYLEKKGVNGTLGAPIADQRCGLRESACIQQFKRGAIYVNTKAKRKAVAMVAPGNAAGLVAVALSQVGYREPKPRKSKYNKWIKKTGPHDPWCGFFVAWVGNASGHKGAVVSRKSFPAMVKAERARHRTTSKPAVGRIAYMDFFGNGKPTHAGIVYKFNGSHVWTVEGNVSAGGRSKHPRGVHIVKHNRSRVVFYANPRY